MVDNNIYVVGGWDLRNISLMNNERGSLTYQPNAEPIPEPATLLLLGTEILGMIRYGNRSKKELEMGEIDCLVRIFPIKMR